MRFGLLTACILLPFWSCTRKPTETNPRPEDVQSSPRVTMDGTHGPGALVPDPVSGEVRVAYEATDKELIKLKEFESQLGLYDKAKTDLTQGKQLFQTHCANCHGQEGQGGGPLADSLDVAPTNFHEWPIKFGSRPIDLALSIFEGRNQVMPAYGANLKPEELWSLVALVDAWIAARPPSKASK